MKISGGTFSLRGAIDIHCEASDLKIIKNAQISHLKAIVLKWPGGSDSAEAAKYINELTNSTTRFFGGVVLDNAVGGLNPFAVRNSAKKGGIFVWLPVQDAMHHRCWNQIETFNAITVIDENGEILPQVRFVLEEIAENKMVLGTGHLSAAEVKAVVDAACEYEIKKIVLNHPLLIGTNDDELEKILRPGVYIEHCYVPNHPKYFDVNLIIKSIKRFGIDNSLIGDFGLYQNDANIADALICFGMSQSEVDKLSIEMPSKILDSFL